MFEFELEKGSKKFTCPNCGAAKKFKRYVRRTTGEYAPFQFGRCDREESCNYHSYPPKEYFIDNPPPKAIPKHRPPNKNALQAAREADILPKKPDYIENEYLLRTLTNYDKNNFVRFLLDLFIDDKDIVLKAVKDYLIGTTKDGKAIFWQIDQSRKIRTGKIIAYDLKTGKRRKDIKPDWIHAALKRASLIKPDFNLRQCFFGEHLLQSDKPIAICEAEKTAVIASVCFPEFVWLAAGSSTNLNAAELLKFKQNQIILYPDANQTAFDRWRNIAAEAQSKGLSVNVSTLIETRATAAQKAEGFDLADYLIDEQRRINDHNNFTDRYNNALESVLNNESMFAAVNRIIDAQNVTDLDSIREIVLRVEQKAYQTAA